MFATKAKDNLKLFRNEYFEKLMNPSEVDLIRLFRELDMTPEDAKLAEKVNTDDAKKWYDICGKYYPTDEILITGETLNFLEKFLLSSGFNKDSTDIPDDLVMEGRIPLPNIIFKLPDEANEHSYRFVLDGQDLYVVDTLDPKEFYRKNMFPNAKTFTMIAKFKHEEHSYSIDLEEIWVSSERMNPHRKDIKISKKQSLIEYYHSCYNFDGMMLQVWYAIQLLLLHPQIVKSDILKRDRKVKVSDSTLQVNKSRKRKACYVKRETVNTDIFNSREFTRKTMCWYVIGHYRKHRDGRVWVNGYWKGPLRDTKKNHDEGRERVLKQGEVVC